MSYFKGHQAGRILFYSRGQLFILLSFPQRHEPTHIAEGNLLYSVYRVKC